MLSRFFVSFILLSFLPFQAGAGCKMDLEFEKTQSSCHAMGHSMEMDVDKNREITTEQKEFCFVCQSQMCRVTLISADLVSEEVFKQNQKSTDFNYKAESYIEHHLTLALRGPPVFNGPKHFLYKHSWQSRLSVFII